MSYAETTYAPYDFANRRHIGPSPAEMAGMLEAVGAPSLDALIDEHVPAASGRPSRSALGRRSPSRRRCTGCARTAAKNEVLTSFIGQGYHGTVTPPVIQRNILENPAWYTAYTPYQPEISQGRLEALLNFQTMVCDLTGLTLANASLLDEATAAAEAMAHLPARGDERRREPFFVDRHCHPQTIAVIQTRAEPLGWEVVVGDPSRPRPRSVFGVSCSTRAPTGTIATSRR